MIHQSVSKLEEALYKRHMRLAHYEQKLRTLPGAGDSRTYNAYYYLIQAGLFSESGMSTKALVVYMGNSYSTVKKALDYIDGTNMLIKTRVGRENHYMLNLEMLDKSFLK